MRRIIGSLLAVGALAVAGGVGGLVASTSHSVGADSGANGLVITTPNRVLDTRNPFAGHLDGGSTTVVSTGFAGASAVAVNITLTDTVTAGFVAAWNGIGDRPGTSIINSFGPNQTIANYAIVPVDSSGKFALFTNQPANLLVDVMGWFPASSPPVPSGITGQITGYGPSYSITDVSGTVSNGGGVSKNVRADVRCPNGTVKTDSVYSLGAGQTKGFSVLCDGVFSSGATVSFVEV